MKIVYGCAGEGRGHAARAAALWAGLSSSLDLTVWCPEAIIPFLHEKCSNICTEAIPGLHFSLKEHRVDYWGTLMINKPIISRFNCITSRMAGQMKDEKVQGVISDFEPLTAIAATKAGIPLINLNHPAVVRRHFSLLPDAVTAKMVASFMTPPAQKNLICSFYNGDVGPILREEIRNAVPQRGDYILVYVKKSSSAAVKKILDQFPEPLFHFFPDPDKDFVGSLSGCGGVIAPAGHQLLSEALFLKKPVLAIPQQGQYEQRLNARMLKASGWGWGTELKRLEGDVKKFIRILPDFPLKSDSFHKFLTDDHTSRAVEIITDFFKRECRLEKLSPRVSCDYFSSIPGKIRRLREMTA